MSEDLAEYYRQRAQRERELAKLAPTEEVAAIHMQLADSYAKLAAGEIIPGLRSSDDE